MSELRPIDVRNEKLLLYWLWLWPVMWVLVVLWSSLDADAFERCPQTYWLTPLIGVAAAGWT